MQVAFALFGLLLAAICGFTFALCAAISIHVSLVMCILRGSKDNEREDYASNRNGSHPRGG